MSEEKVSIEETLSICHEFAAKAKELLETDTRVKKMVSEVSSEDHEFIRQELARLANFLGDKYKLNVQDAKRVLHEMLGHCIIF